MKLHTMLVMYYKRNDVDLDISVKNIFTDYISNKHLGCYTRQSILKQHKMLDSCSVESFDFVDGRMVIQLYCKHKCSKSEYFNGLERDRYE